MSRSYCLLDEPWLPVRLQNGRLVELGLLEVFARSNEITALAETAPPSLVAEYRLLLAITHRALVDAFAQWRDKDRLRWYREGLPLDTIKNYLEELRERFWLFHPDFPFMQVAALATAEDTRDKRKPWTQIALASANGNTPLVFDHANDVAPKAIRPSYAVSTLLGFLQFTPGGLVKSLRDADKAGALVNTAAVLPVCDTLAKTLCLALHPAPRAQADPDLPAWERQPLSIAALRGGPVRATGPNDRYTRQSRAVLLCREVDGQIRWLHFAAGLALGEDLNAPDPMASYRAGSNGLVRISFTEGRALWRDLPALVPNPSGESQAAAVLQQAASLREQSDDPGYQPLLLAGLASDQAKLLRWRIEQVSLPAVLMLNIEKALYLREQVAFAESLFRDLSGLAIRMQAETLPDPSSKDSRSRARDLVNIGPLAKTYFAQAERAMPELLQLIADGKPERADALWKSALRVAAKQAWRDVVAGLGNSASAARAEALYWWRFVGLLNRQIPKQESVLSKEVQ